MDSQTSANLLRASSGALNPNNADMAHMSRSISAVAPTTQTASHHVRPRGPTRAPSLPSIRTALVAGTSGTSTSFAESKRRARSASIVSVQEIKADYEETLDQEALNNINADWVNYKGAWLIHVIILTVAKVVIDILPGISQVMSWTIVLQGYMFCTYVMFHYVTGTPFDAHSGAYDQLTMWEQIDNGAQYTPAKKWLTSLPIFLFLLSTHYTRYDRHPTLFTLNILSLLFVGLAPKLPQMHRLRIRFFEPLPVPRRGGSTPGIATPLDGKSGPPTPITEETETPTTPYLSARSAQR